MKRIVFECEFITPLFMYGANKNSPELRPSSIKGAMRFWWRAINGDLPIEKLREKEAKIFGSLKKKSSIIIYPIKENKEFSKSYYLSLTPHHKKGYCSKNEKNCFFDKKNLNQTCKKANKREGKLYKFDLIIGLRGRVGEKKEKEIEELLKIMFLLGGLGKRSRRGFGSVSIQRISLLKKDGNNYAREENNNNLKKIRTFIDSIPKIDDSKKCPYPVIRNIEIGKNPYSSFDELLEQIGKATHENSCGKTIFKVRMASPIYVSVVKVSESDYRPIITTLHCNCKGVFQKNYDFKRFIESSINFKKDILEKRGI